MPKARVYELAKRLNISARELLDELELFRDFSFQELEIIAPYLRLEEVPEGKVNPTFTYNDFLSGKIDAGKRRK